MDAGSAPLDVEALVARMAGPLAILEPLEARHEAEMFAAAREPEIFTWWPIDPARSRESFARWSARWRAELAAREVIRFATLDARTGAVIGGTSYLNLFAADRGVEIGWTWLAPAAWGTGANADAKLLMLGRAFDAGAMRVALMTDERNARSRRAIEAIPAQFEGVLRDQRLLESGRRRSTAAYSVLDREWPEVRAALAARVARHAGAA